MRKTAFTEWCLRGGVLLLSGAFFILPSLGADVFLSPDETANAVTASTFVESGSFVFPDGVVRAFPWAHPRSFAAMADGLVPVGFLGMSLLLGPILKIFGLWGMLALTPLLALSVLWPLWSFTRSWGRSGQVATLVGWMTFPTVLLYANRGLFPNLPVVCLAIWAAWCVWRSRSTRSLIVAGLLTGVALTIRPTEVIWVLPWIIAARVFGSAHTRDVRKNIHDAGWFFTPLLVVCAIGAIFGWKTYGTWFTAGYQARDPIVGPEASLQMSTEAISPRSLFETWPFGFHPRNVWFNVRSYLIVYLLPWFLLVLAAAALAWKKKGSKALLILATWTIVSLSLLYGQSLYQDHIKLNQVSLANSFLRYLLPISVIAAVSLGWCASHLTRNVRRYGTFFAILLVALIGIFGTWTAFSRDDEGIVQDIQEIAKYRTVREEAFAVLSPGSFVLSERSDKLFFPVFRAVSPLPSREHIHELLEQEDIPVAMYLRTLTPEQLEEWRKDRIELRHAFTVGNESLYLAWRLL